MATPEPQRLELNRWQLGADPLWRHLAGESRLGGQRPKALAGLRPLAPAAAVPRTTRAGASGEASLQAGGGREPCRDPSGLHGRMNCR